MGCIEVHDTVEAVPADVSRQHYRQQNSGQIFKKLICSGTDEISASISQQASCAQSMLIKRKKTEVGRWVGGWVGVGVGVGGWVRVCD